MRAHISRHLALCAALATLQFAAEVTAILHRHRLHESQELAEEAEDGEALAEESEGGAATGTDSIWQCSVTSESIDEDSEEYLIDNSLLQAKTKGMGYRFGKDLKNVDRKSFALWGTTIRGKRENDDWIKVGDCFLPMHLKGVRVLTPTRIAFTIAAPLKDPAEGTALERLPEAAPSPREAAVASGTPSADLQAPVAGVAAQALPIAQPVAASVAPLAGQLAPVAGIVAEAPPQQAPPLAVAAARTTALKEQALPAIPGVAQAPSQQVVVTPPGTVAASVALGTDLLRPLAGQVARAPLQQVQLPLSVAPAPPIELPPVAVVVERRCSGQGTGGRYMLDNSKLQAQTKGMGLRFSKDTKNIDKSAKAVWGSTIIGTDLGDGWLQVGECYLPMELKGIPVLTPLDAPAQSGVAEAPQTAVVAAVEPSQVAAQAPQTVAAAAPQSAPVPSAASPTAAVGVGAPSEPLQAPQTLPMAPLLVASEQTPQAVAVVASEPLQIAAAQASYSVTTVAPAQALQSTSAETSRSAPAEESRGASEPPYSTPTAPPVAVPQSVTTEALQTALAPESLTAPQAAVAEARQPLLVGAPLSVDIGGLSTPAPEQRTPSVASSAPASDVAASVAAEASSAPIVSPATASPLPAERGPATAGGGQLAAPAQTPQQPPAVAVRSKCSLEGAIGQQSAYKLDNSVLQATTKGMGLRLSKNLKDIDKTTKAPWGSTVLGVDLGDGWLQIGSCYLPMTLQGVTVLTLMQSSGVGSAEAARPAAGVVQASTTETSPQPLAQEAVAPAAAGEVASTTEAMKATIESAPEPQAPPTAAPQRPAGAQDAEPRPAEVLASTTEAPRAPLEPAEQAAFQRAAADDLAAPSRAEAQASSTEAPRAALPLDQEAPTADPEQLQAHELVAQALNMPAKVAEIPRAALEQSVQQKALQMATSAASTLLSAPAGLEPQAWAASSSPAALQPAAGQLEAAPGRRAPPVLPSEPEDELPVQEPPRPAVASTDDFQRGSVRGEEEAEVQVLKERAAAAERKATAAEQETAKQLAQLEEELLEAKENVSTVEQAAAKSIAALQNELSNSKSSAQLLDWTARQRIAGLEAELSEANEAAKEAGEAKASADAKGYALEEELKELRDQEHQTAQELQTARADADEKLRKLRTEAEGTNGAAAAKVADFEERLLQQRQAMEALTDRSAKVLRDREYRIGNLTRQLEDAKAFAARDIAHYEQLSAQVNATAARREAELLQELNQARAEAHDSSFTAERKAAVSEARAEELQRQLDDARKSAAESFERLTREAASADAIAQQRLHELEAQLAKEQEAARSAAAESARMIAANEVAGAALQKRLADLRQKAVEVGSAVAKHVSKLEEELQKEVGPVEASSAAVMATRQVDAAVDSTNAEVQLERSRERHGQPRDNEDPGTGAFGELRRLRARSARSQDLARELSNLGSRALEATRALAKRTADLAQELPARHSGRSAKDSRAREIASQLGDLGSLSSDAVEANEALSRAASDMEEELSRQHFALQSANEAVQRQLEATHSGSAVIVGPVDGADNAADLANASATALGELAQLPERLEGLTRQAKLRSGALSAKIQALRQELEEEKEATRKAAADANAALEGELEESRRNASESLERSQESERRAAQLGEQLREMRQEARYDAERLQTEAARTSEAERRISDLTEQLGKQRLDKLQADADLQSSQTRSAELERQLAALRSEANAAGDKAARRIAELEEKLGDQLS